MKSVVLAFLAIALGSSSASAQNSSRRPDQFYTDGQNVNAWTVNERQGVRTTLWFAKVSADDTVYRQMLAVIYNSKPEEVFYVDSATRMFTGRLNLDNEKFSLIPENARRPRLADIDEAVFSAPGELPRVSEMFDSPPSSASANRHRLQLPPPTPQFPRLERSTWQTCYMSADRFQIRSTLELNNDRGTYRLNDKPGTGRLSNIQYERESESHLIHGDWALGQSNGWFKFTVPEENLNVFWGEFGFERGRVVGAWSGFREP